MLEKKWQLVRYLRHDAVWFEQGATFYRFKFMAKLFKFGYGFRQKNFMSKLSKIKR